MASWLSNTVWSSCRAKTTPCPMKRWLGLQVTWPATTPSQKHNRKRALFQHNYENFLFLCFLFCFTKPTHFLKGQKRTRFKSHVNAPLSVWTSVVPTIRFSASLCSLWFPASVTWRLHLIFTSLTRFTHLPVGDHHAQRGHSELPPSFSSGTFLRQRLTI